MFDIRVDPDGQVLMTGRLDAAESERALEILRGLERSLTLDCSGLDYISSAGIGVIIETYKRLRSAGHTLKLVKLVPRLREIFAYAGVDRVLTIE
jgi:anti-anti-sigma factor